MLLLPNQFHNSIEYLSLIGQTEASMYDAAIMIFLYERSANSTKDLFS